MSTQPPGFQQPKTNWVISDPITTGDLNRIERNINAIETGERTLEQALPSPANAGTLRQILSWFAGRIRAITGAANWWDSPATTLVATNEHIQSTAPHSATSVDVANRLILRDGAGRARISKPTAAEDIARLDTISILNPMRTTGDRWYVAGQTNTHPLVSIGLSSNYLHAVPLIIPNRVTIDRLGLTITTAGSGLARMGIYTNIPGTLVPNLLLAAGADVPLTSSVFVNVPVSLLLEPGIYWAAIVSSGSAEVRGISHGGSGPILGYSPPGQAITPGYYWGTGFIFAPLPTTFPTTSLATPTTLPPAIYVRVISS